MAGLPAAGKRKTAELLYGPYTRRTLGGAKQWTMRGSKPMQKRRLSYSHAAGRLRVGGYQMTCNQVHLITPDRAPQFH